MPRRRLGRFLLEVVFLAGVAAAVTVARFHAPAVIAMMAAAWIVVAVLEWAAMRDVPHYGRGLPPRYYVPQVALPPPRAVEQYRPYAYPAQAIAEEEATWIAPAGEWGETLVDWPVLGSQTGEQTQILEDALLDDEPLDDALLDDEAVGNEALEEEPSPTAPAELTVAGGPAVGWDGLEPAVEEDEETDEANRAEPDLDEPQPEVVRPPAVPAVEYEPVALALPQRVERPALHHVDPLGAPSRRRWFGRADDDTAIEVRDGPPPNRVLPGAGRSGPASGS